MGSFSFSTRFEWKLSGNAQAMTQVCPQVKTKIRKGKPVRRRMIRQNSIWVFNTAHSSWPIADPGHQLI